MVQLTSPSFTGLPTDEVEEVDVYGEVDDEVKNKLVSHVTAFGVSTNELIEKSTKSVKDLGDKLDIKGKLAAVKDVRDKIQTEADKVKSVINKAKEYKEKVEAVRTRIKEALGGSRTAIAGLAGDLDKVISFELLGEGGVSGLVKTATDLKDEVQVVIDTTNYYFKEGNIKSVGGVLDFITDISGTSVLKSFDLGAQAAVMKGIVTEITSWNIPELLDETFGAVWNEAKGLYDYVHDFKFRFSVVKRSSESLSPGTSLAMIDRLITHGGDKALIAVNPDFPVQLIANYVLPYSTTPGEPELGKDTYADELRKLVKILDNLKPDWFMTKRNGKAVFNLYFMSHASQDAITLFSSSEVYRECILVSPYYIMESGKDLILRMYPEAIV